MDRVELMPGCCTAATIAFYAGLDRRDYAMALAALAPDAVWERHDGIHQGRDAIAALLDQRPANLLTAHLVNNPVVIAIDPERASIRYSLLILAGDTDIAPQVGKVVQLRHCEDQVALHDGRWVIEHKTSELIFNIS